MPSKKIRYAAMALLARREHSSLELEQKLERRFPEKIDKIKTEIARLTAEGLQSDSRMAESFIRSRVNRGQGPCKIKMALKIKGVALSDIVFALYESEVDWFTLASSVAVKKFGIIPGQDIDWRMRSKVSKFLQQRGFSYEHIASVYRSS